MPIPVEGSNPIVVPLRSKRQRKALTIQKLNHAVPALGLLIAGREAIASGRGGLDLYLGVFELLSAAALIVLTARHLRMSLQATHHAHPTHAHGGVDWVDIAAGFMLVAEALEHWHVTHHYARPVIVSAIATFALGLFHGRLAARAARRRVLRVDDDGIFVAGRPFKARKLDLAWSEVASVEVGERWAIITTRGGQVRKLDLPDLEGEQHVRHALQHARQLLGGGAGRPAAPIPANTAE